MYDPEVTRIQLENAEKRLGWKLRRKSVEEVIAGNQLLANLVNDKGELVRPLEPSEQKWITNEQTLCRWDFRYWLSRYHHVLSWKDNTLVRMEPNIAQNIFLEVIAESERKKWAIMMIILKARQLGMSTVCEAIIAHRVQFHPNVIAVVASARPDKSEKMVMMCERSWLEQPWFLLPKMDVYRSGDFIGFTAMGSSVSIQHGAKIRSGIARGDTPSAVHLSEVSEFLNPKDDIDAALLNALHENPKLFLALESTAKGMANWWHNKWEYAKEHYDNPYQPSRLRPVFLPWYVGRDLYPTETWLRRNRVPPDWVPSELTRRHAERAQTYARGKLRTYLGGDWEMPREQMWFWEVNYLEHKRTKELNKFFQEMPADDIEAFQQEQQSVFDVELITEYRNACPCPKGIYALEAPLDEVRAELRPDRRNVDVNTPPIVIDHRYSLIPLKKDEWPNMDPNGKILIWHYPEEGHDYGAGVDTSDGIGLDRSVIEIVRKATLFECAVQVAEFASPYIGAADLTPFCFALGKYYGRPSGGVERQPLFVIEVNGGGDACQLGMRKQGWSNFYQWVRYDRKRIEPSRAVALGAVTNVWSRKLVLEYLIKALKDYFLEINSPWFVMEMGTLGREEDMGRIQAESLCHDDRIMSLGWAFLGLHILDWQNEHKGNVFSKPRASIAPPETQREEYAELPVTDMQIAVADTTIDKIMNNENPWYELGIEREEMPWR